MAIDKKIIVTVETDKGAQNIDKLNDSITLLNGKQNDLKENVKNLTKVYKDAQGDLEAQAEANKKLALAQTELNTNSMALRDAKKALNTETKAQKDAEGSFLDQISGMPGIIGKAGQSIQGFGSALKLLAANPIGLILTAIVGVITLLTKAFERNQDSVNKLGKVTGTVSGAFQGFLKILEPVANFLVDKLLAGFESAAKGVDKLTGFISKGLKMIGLNAAAKGFDDFTNSIKQTSVAGEKLAEAEQKLATRQRESRKIQLDYQRDAEKQRQIRDDESKSIAQRITANQKLGVILKNQSNAELSIANEAVRVAKLRIDVNGKTKENLDELAAKQTEVADIQERITGQESEQLVNLSSLRKQDAQNSINYSTGKLEAKKLERKALDEARLSDETYFNDRKKMLQDDVEETIRIIKEQITKNLITKKNGDILIEKTEAQLQKDLLDLNQKRVEALINDLKYEVDLQKLKDEEILAGKKQTNEELHKAELKRIEQDRKANEDALNIRLKNEPEKEKEINQQIELVNQQAKTATAKSNFAFSESEKNIKEQNLYTDYSNQLAALSEFSMERYDLQAKQMDLDKEKELDNVELTQEQRLHIEQKYTKLKKDLAANERDYKINTAKDLVTAIGSIAKEGSKIAKIAASTAAAINTYTEISGIFASTAKWGPLGWALGSAKAAISAINGASTIKKIWAADGNSTPTSTANTEAVVAPTITATSNTLTNTEQSLQNKSQKVYVVESDITDAQNKVNVVKTESTF